MVLILKKIEGKIGRDLAIKSFDLEMKKPCKIQGFKSHDNI
jgi:hypothetical protein